MEALRRVVYRAVVVGLGEELLALALVPSTGRGAAAAGYPLFAIFLAIPAALVTAVELGAEEHRVEKGPLAAALAAVAAFVGMLLAHFQAVYASAIVEIRSITEGIARLRAEWDELFVTGTSSAGTIVARFLVVLVVPFVTASTPWFRQRPALHVLGVLIAIVLPLEAGPGSSGDTSLRMAALLAALTVPVLFALADSLAARRPQEDEENAR